MYPGVTTRVTSSTVASATTIKADTDVVRLTGTTAIATITPRTMNKAGQSLVLFIIPIDGNVATTTAGNIIAVQTMLQNRVTMLVWDQVLQKWFPHALA